MSNPNIKPRLPSGKSIKRYDKQAPKAMTLEELKEELTKRFLPSHLTEESREAAVSLTIQTFIQFCEENDIYQVMNKERIVKVEALDKTFISLSGQRLKSVKEVMK